MCIFTHPIREKYSIWDFRFYVLLIENILSLVYYFYLRNFNLEILKLCLLGKYSVVVCVFSEKSGN